MSLTGCTGLLLVAWPRINAVRSHQGRPFLNDDLRLLGDAQVHGRIPVEDQPSKGKLLLCGPDMVYMKGKRHVHGVAAR